MRILLTGSTGFVGRHLERALRERGHEVVGCARGAAPVHCDFTRDHRPEDWLGRVTGMDVVINAAGIAREQGAQSFAALHERAPAALFTACEQAGVGRVIQISVLGADPAADDPWLRSRGRSDADLAARPLDWLILRPSIVHGEGGASTGFLRALAALPWVPLVGDGGQMLQPVHVDDLVRAVVQAVECGEPRCQVLDCVGAEPVTLARVLARWRAWLGAGRWRALPVAPRLARAGAALAGRLHVAPVNGSMVDLLRRGSTAPVEPFERGFGWRPRGFAGALAARPSSEAELWHARLYGLRPLLRFALAFFWIWTGLVSALLHPPQASLDLLASAGLTAAPAVTALYGLALVDVLLGLALLAGWRVREVAWIQVVMMAGYTLGAGLLLPQLWIDPFGPLSKNLPLIVATLMLIAMEGPRRCSTSD
ncbi:SDR family oxidoreductase [Thioalkalivibrio halophilus]|uniref:NAD(P)-binding domain-containing protein n=1 Tax=Thioalkalivibrio halophilus TaxID=252474 RepID=A0A1V2ZUW2_9GAMM|nr:SDR family oxidoreductase [Thioalkalivibrio halophilus]OOC08917.1 hypothetical protein B1A74_13730 [Thioalkalivibrio halophilus]